MKVYGITPQVTGYNSSITVPRSAPASTAFNTSNFIKPVEPAPLGYPPVGKPPINSCPVNKTFDTCIFTKPKEPVLLVYNPVDEPPRSPYLVNSTYLNAQGINFGYQSVLKTYWLKGKMPSVKFDMGGNRLTKENISLGHMLPHSKGGPTSLSNLMLETRKYNMMKGNSPFSMFFDKEAFEKYCEQFKGIDLPEFNGKDYVKMITKTAQRLLKQGK